ncbi:methyltransferase domain-containing protein [Rhodohalobacter sp. 614A]|uniref:methyltransferase domain-containing protein n=1 Tax=Rhodohalobacter sp. 614A TaxID=2908649 RepID=UPI001F2CACED|nr:methyltransferase domain-containing protein [Rhodohalobacter sp. 614A]
MMDFEYKKSIINYYDATQLDYRILWFREKNRSVHFGYYDQDISNHGEALLNMNKVMAQKSGVKSGDLILDAGCGQGGSSVWLAEHFDVHVTGITLVPHQVLKAQKHAEKSKINHRVSFFEKDYTNTGFEDESFTLIWACESLCHALNKIDFYKEVYRLLKPGGRLICAEYFRSNRPLAPEGEKLLHEWLNGWSIKDIDTVEEHKKNATQCGFKDIRIEDITEFTKPSLEYLHSMSRKLWNVGRILRRIGLRNHINHGNHYSSIKQYEALNNDLWHYGLLSMKK